MKKLTTYHLKWIATALMVLDHIGYLLVPSSTWTFVLLRSVGRLSAPLFWYCFAVGFYHTSNKMRYLLRLGAGAGVMMIGNTALSLLIDGLIRFSWRAPNIFLTMFGVGLLILLLERIKSILPQRKLESVGLALLSLVLAFLIFRYGEYGRFALACILSFYFIKEPWLRYGLAGGLCIFFCIWAGNWRQLWMLASFPIMWLCGKEKPRRSNKYFFYIFYPAHLWLLAAVACLIRILI